MPLTAPEQSPTPPPYKPLDKSFILTPFSNYYMLLTSIPLEIMLTAISIIINYADYYCTWHTCFLHLTIRASCLAMTNGNTCFQYSPFNKEEAHRKQAIFVDQNQMGIFSIPCLVGSFQNFTQFPNINLWVFLYLWRCITKPEAVRRQAPMWASFSYTWYSATCSSPKLLTPMPLDRGMKHQSSKLKGTIQCKKGLGKRFCEELLRPEHGR